MQESLDILAPLLEGIKRTSMELTANESGGNLSNKSCNRAIVESVVCYLFFVFLEYIFIMLWILVDVTSCL